MTRDNDRTGMKITFDELHKYCVKHADFFTKHIGDEVLDKEDFWEGIDDFLGYKTKMGRWAAVMYGVYIDKDHITVGMEIPGRPELGWDGDYTGFILEALDDIPDSSALYVASRRVISITTKTYRWRCSWTVPTTRLRT